MKSITLLTAILLACVPAVGADDAVLYLTNGGFLPGELKSSEQPTVLRWQSTKFTQPFEFSLSGVAAVQFVIPSTLPKPTGEYCLELAAGDVLFGELLGLTDDFAEVEVARFGRVHVKRDQIRRLYRWNNGADLIYLGPNGLTEWKETSATKLWREEGGQPLTDQEGANIRGDFGLPAQAIIEFELAWKSKPDFVFALGVNDSDDESVFKRAFRFEVWDNELVVRCELGREADVDSVQEVSGGRDRAGRAHFLAYLDQEKGRLLVYSPNGTPQGQINVTPRKPQVHSGLRLTNKRGDVRLERLRISRWNGIPPREVQANKSRLHRTDGSIAYGTLATFDSNLKQFTVRDGNEEIKVAADQISSVFLSPPNDEVARAFRAVYLDGTRLSGDLTTIADDHLRLTNPAIQEPLRLPLSELRSFAVLKHEDTSANSSAEGRTGRLELDGLRLHGRLTDGREQTAASCLVWHPDFSNNASPLCTGAVGRIVYRDPPPPKPKLAQSQQQPQPVGFADAFLKALAGGPNAAAPVTAGKRTMHLRSGDTIPCEVTKISEEGINFKTTLSDATFVSHDKVKAVELTVVDGPPKLNKTKRERLLTLPRLQRDSPPTQLIRSKNGDFLRGRVIDMDDQELRLEVRIETKKIPRDRISQIIWFHPDELIDAANATGERGGVSPPVNSSADSSPKDREADSAPFAKSLGPTRVQAFRSDGIRLTFFPEQFADKTLSGKSEVLGNCRAEVDQVDQFLIGTAIEKSAADLAYHRWKLHHAVEPKIAQDVDGSSPDGRAPGIESPLVGKTAPDFQLELLGSGGKKFRLADQKGKVVVLDFWATWCGPCLQTMPLVDKVVHEFDGQDVQLIAVNLEESAKTITATLERHKMNVTVALDQDGVAATKYQATAIPQTVIIDREGKVARLFVGGGPKLADQLRDALQSIVTGGDATKPTPK